MLATIDVIGATVVTTRNLPPPNGPEADEPAVEAAAGQTNSATNTFAAELSSLLADVLLPHPTNRAHNEPATTAVDLDLLRLIYTPSDVDDPTATASNTQQQSFVARSFLDHTNEKVPPRLAQDTS